MAECFDAAAGRGWLNPRTIAVLPEHLGTWLVTAGEPDSVYSAKRVSDAMRPIVLRHLLPFFNALLTSGAKDRVTASLFQAKGQAMAGIYQAVFARLAMEYGVTIAPGSILLPEPSVVGGAIRAGDGPLYNCAFVFRPDGSVEPQVVRKFAPIESELLFTEPGGLADLPVFDTPAGRLGILICADAWHPEPYARLREQGVDLLAVPSASPAEIWEQAWGGYNGRPAPLDVDPADAGRITERQAWGKYALSGRISSAGARVGVNVFLYGDLWDLEFSGGRWRLIRGEENIEASRYSPALVNVWMDGLPICV